jgi:hypothetical protein
VEPGSGERDFVEDGWVGKTFAIGDEVRISIIGPCPRCVMTTLPQGVAAAVALRVKADGSQSYEVVAQLDARQNKFVSRPLDLGPEGDQVFLLLLGTGIRFGSSPSAVIATIGGVYAEVNFAGAQGDFVGLD